MKIVFFGTPYYVLPILEALHKSFKDQGKSPIAAVVTQPPKPAGRKQLLEYSEVDTWAYKKGIPKYFDAGEIIRNGIKADVGILASYGALIPKEVISYFPYGILVVHPSLLPKFRWGSPVPATIVTNTNPTGVSIIKMDEKWDHGPVITQFKEDLKVTDTYGSLRDRLFELTAEVLVQMLPAYIQGKIKLKPQDDSKASYARIIKKEDSFIPPKYLEAAMKGVINKDSWEIPFIKDADNNSYSIMPSAQNMNSFIRAMDPWPIAWTNVKLGSDKEVKRLRILKAHIEGDNLILDEVQLEGKNPVTWEQFKQGYSDFELS